MYLLFTKFKIFFKFVALHIFAMQKTFTEILITLNRYIIKNYQYFLTYKIDKKSFFT